MKYFTINELCASSTAARLGIRNIPNEEIKSNLIALVDNVLDPLRTSYGKPIIVTSGYRCPKLNQAVGGSKTSQHSKGMAADIVCTSSSEEGNKELFDLVLSLNLDFDQLIWEYGSWGTENCGPDWIHISFVNPSENRHQILRAYKQNKRTVYEKIK